ncbi:MAG: plasma-membrane proton-efflux P-type ATPase, partial [Promethearchaeota archaeon]
MNATNAKKISIPQLFNKLSTSNEGLSSSEVTQRIQEFGYNEISEKKTNAIIKFLKYFWGPIPWMIETAAILSGVIRHWEDFSIILALLLLNAIVGFLQENKADNAIKLLKEKLALKARVKRDGKWLEISSRELVVGDLIRIRLGDIVPADVKLIEKNYLLTDESALTGESLPVEKRNSDVAYSGSIIRQGETNAIVFATGMNTYFGKTAKLVKEAKSESHFEKNIIKIGNFLIILAVALVSLVFIAAILRHEALLEIFQFALVLVVAAIPVALPAVLTVTMAIGATALAKKEAIVSKLVAIQEMAGVDVLCSDKTGTITKNELSIAKIETFSGSSEEKVLLISILASREEDKDPIDNAIIEKANQMPSLAEMLKIYSVIEFKPFDPVVKRTEATIMSEDKTLFKVTKGAPQVILSLAFKKDELHEKINSVVDEFATKGYRALGVAKTDKEGNWQYLGLLALYDPPRDDSAETIKSAQKMGLTVKMVTGDHEAVAKEIAHEVHLGTNILPASAFQEKSDTETQKLIDNADGFAQVFPEHKYHIVELLQNEGHIVGMTGDGINDAPALKKANTGIAVAGATDAAKESADIVLTKPGLSVIIDSVKQSRKVFSRMTNYSIFRIAETIRVLIFLTMAILIFIFYPLTPVMIVFLAILNDAPIMMIAFDNVKHHSQPVRWDMKRILIIATFLGLIGVVASFSLFWIADLVLHLDRATIQTLIFLKMA